MNAQQQLHNSVEEDGDEVFSTIESVRCCQLGFTTPNANGLQFPIYTRLVATRTMSGIWWLCPKCKGSYGAATEKDLS